MIPAVERYRTDVKKQLLCCKDTKARLLESFDKNLLSPLLEVSDHPSGEELCTAFGTPAEAAALLMEQVTEEEAQRYRNQKKLCKAVAIGTVAMVMTAIMIFAAYIFFVKEFSNITFIDSAPYNITSNEGE